MTTHANEHADPPPPMIDCETAVRRLWDFLDAELDAPRAEELESHLAVCQLCPPHFEFARTFLDAVAVAGRPGGTDPSDALRGRVLAALRAEGYTRGG